MQGLPSEPTQSINNDEKHTLDKAIDESWSKISPFWPLKNLIAVNPLSGFEHLPFEDALMQGQAFFQQPDLPADMLVVNRESIKWLQAYFDNGQAAIAMPSRHKGFLNTVKTLMVYDQNLRFVTNNTSLWFNNLPDSPYAIIQECLLYIQIPKEHSELLLTLMLTTLPGWAGHIQYRTSWADTADQHHAHPITKMEYLAFRLIMTALVWPKAKQLVEWHTGIAMTGHSKRLVDNFLTQLDESETQYRTGLLNLLSSEYNNDLSSSPKAQPDAQLVFCIDVRSEPFRRSLEAQGQYETFGFAGFFGVPVSIENQITGESYHSCPVLLKPAHHIKEVPVPAQQQCQDGHQRQQSLKKLYQSLKYNFTTPFALVETIGPASGLWMGLQSLLPGLAQKLRSMSRHALNPVYQLEAKIEDVPIEEQVAMAGGALQLMGLTKNFAPLVVFCGHGSTTQNNAYATALDCGACGGRHGAPNARILAAILNCVNVRSELLAKANISIPAETYFLAAEHNTTTDQIALFEQGLPKTHNQAVNALKADLGKACLQNTYWRCAELGVKAANSATHAILRSQDWAQVRPEWGLARNAALIIGPRSATQNLDLKGRSFLHSYDWTEDQNANALTTILTAPMVVAQWINSQYLFSTFDNVAFGGGNKITKNITGKIGIMQGNASDLMNGLPLQSIFKDDNTQYHEPMRLMTIVFAPKKSIDSVVRAQALLQKLFGNGWVTLVCIDPELNEQLVLQRDLTWARFQ